MASTKSRSNKLAPQTPKRRRNNSRLGGGWVRLLAALSIVAIGVIVVVALDNRKTKPDSSGGSAVSSGLPNTPDYHSLLVAPGNPQEVLLGTHQGIFRSRDGGAHWASYALPGNDAMNLARPDGKGVAWMAGHDVFARSNDGCATWQMLKPASLPSLDLHGFAVDPRTTSTLYAAVAGNGLFRSTDSGRTFNQVSKRVGGEVMALALTPGGAILAGDMQRGLLESKDGGTSWTRLLNAQLAGLAVNPKNPSSMLATGPGIQRSMDGGKTWRLVKRIDAGAGPVAFAPSDPRIAYVVGFDRTLYRSGDGGSTWAAIGGDSQ